MIYFILDERNKAIKIGVALYPEDRLNKLQTGNPSPLRLLGVIPGGIVEEAKLHQQFERDRIRGEWFSAVPATIKALHEMIHQYGRTPVYCAPVDFTFSKDWGVMNSLDTSWPGLQRAIRIQVYKATGILCTVYSGSEPFITGAKKRIRSFQLMPDQGDHERHPFWGWHVDLNPQWFATPGDAAHAWIGAFRFWRSLQGVALAEATPCP